ncbi:hypothetical protein [Streptomyces sp. RerS4]|nr:hypothetical protein [Streptomyces sp. RerS4]UQX04565.1 hypothetical protein M4D82_31665 [Streptomyces sp. RerS4]
MITNSRGEILLQLRDDIPGGVITAAMVALRATTPDPATLLSDHVAQWG